MERDADRGLQSLLVTGEPARRHLQKRLALFLLVMAIFLSASLAIIEGITAILVSDRFWAISLEPGRVVHLVNASLAWTGWAACRRLRWSQAGLRHLDVATTVMFLLLFSIDLGTNPPIVRPDLTLVIVMNLVLILRAALVPSSLARSLSLGGIAVVAALTATWNVYGAADVSARYLASIISLSVVFMGMTVAASALVSQVIYGLRQRASEAVRLGQYTLEEKIGEGGMGVVYRASHAMLKRPTAVKLIAPDKASDAHLVRFEREVQLTAGLAHPNTISIYDYGRTAEGVFYYAMEYLDGLTLDALVARDGPQPAGRVAHVMRQVCAALAEAHGIGLVHRDIKPANIMLCARGGEHDVVKVLDFGMVKQLADAGTQLSLEHSIVGTPLFIAPECIRAPELTDARADLYALGAVGYYMITGSYVFTGNNAVEVFSHHLHTPPDPPAQRLGRPIPAVLEDLILSCLAKEPEGRPASAAALARALATTELAWSAADAEQHWHGSGARRPAPADASPLRLTVDVGRRLDHGV